MSTSKSDHRYFDQALGIQIVQLLPGECYVTQEPEAIVTVLGSCISVCIRDPKTDIGGMNHFLLPENNSNGSDGERYGAYAMRVLIDGIANLSGSRDGLEVKIFGGGNILNFENSVGRQNIEFVHEFLEKEGLAISSEDVGGSFSRKIRYFPDSGKVQVKRLENLYNKSIVTCEKELAITTSVASVQNKLQRISK